VLAAITDEGRQVAEAATKDLMAADFGLTMLNEPERAAMFEALRKVRALAGDFEAPDLTADLTQRPSAETETETARQIARTS
jgi:hypothetical protein